MEAETSFYKFKVGQLVYRFPKEQKVEEKPSVLLPNSERAFIDIKKLENYCLNPVHPVGKNKAVVFKSALGITSENAAILRNAIFEALNDGKVTSGRQDPFGKRYIVDVEIRNLNKKVVVRTAWIIKHSEDFSRLTTCYVK